MNHYEILAIISGRFAENEVEPQFGKIEAIVKKYGGPIHYRQNLDRKRLAYPIDHQLYGYYFLLEFDAEPSAIAKIDRELKLSGDVLRHNLVKRLRVGKPRITEHKTSLEQEAFGKIGGKTLGFDVETPAPATVSKPEVAQPTVVATPAPQEPIVINEQGVETTTVESSQENQTITPPEEPTETEMIHTSKKKKDHQKVSYEELDKKLDDILNNDII